MVLNKIIRAWKDPEYRADLSEDELKALPQNPAGAIELTDEELDMAAGGSWRHSRSYTSSRSYSNSRSGSWSRPPSRSWRRSMSRSYYSSRSYSNSSRPSSYYSSRSYSNSRSYSHRP